MTSVLLLSGGASKRMGQDKASLTFGEQSLLSFQINRFEAAGFPVVHSLKDVYNGFKGPLAGIHSALHQHEDVSSWVVVPVDMPQLSVDAIKTLISEGNQRDQHAAFSDCPLPVYLNVQSSTKALLEQWLSDENGKRSVYAFLNGTNGCWVDDQQFKNELTNINTPEQWQAFTKEAV